MSLRSVDLPHPEGPKIARNEPRSMSRSMRARATVSGPKKRRRPRMRTEAVTSGAGKLNGSPELLPDLPLDASPELVARLLRRPQARFGVDVEVPGLGSGRHPDLTCRAMAVHDEPHAVL